MPRTIVIGGAAGAWGDTSFAAPQLLQDGRCQYILFEALAEITMGILTRARQKDPKLGYATDVIHMIAASLPELHRQGIKVVTNAGGINPQGAAEALQAAAERLGMSLRVATVAGDDLFSRRAELSLGGSSSGLTDFDAVRPGGRVPPEAVMSFNAYLGAFPIARALGAGADVVITGRVVDSALALGPLIHEFGWGASEYDRLAQGSLAGHLLECGPQASGGLLTDWQDLPSWEDIGYPIAECAEDGSFVLTKARGTGGLVDERGVAEQLLYEIGDPGAYLLPDVTCDFRQVELALVGQDRVSVRGAKGRPPPPTLKACAQVLDGYKLTVQLFLGGRDAVLKAERLASDILRRVSRYFAREGFGPITASDIEVLGAESTYGPHSRARGAREVLLKLALAHPERRALEGVVREIPGFGLAVPGLTGGGSGLARPTPVVRLQSYLLPRDQVPAVVLLDGQPVEFTSDVAAGEQTVPAPTRPELAPLPLFTSPAGESIEVPLVALAHARSGDKGAHANIGVRARHPDFLPLLAEQLTEAAVAEYFAHRVSGAVHRFELPGISALNFLLEDALGGGGIASLRFDSQGKAYAQQLLDFSLRVPLSWLDHPSVRGVQEVLALRAQRKAASA